MQHRRGWRAWHGDTRSMSATYRLGFIAPGSLRLRDAAAVSGMSWTVSTVIKAHRRAHHAGNSLLSRRSSKDILTNEKPPHNMLPGGSVRENPVYHVVA